MQNVTKLPNENIQNYQLEMFKSEGGGKLPNANCDQTTKWKYPKLPTRNVWFWRVSKLPNTIVTKLPNENIQNYQLEMFDFGGEGSKLPNANVTKLPNENIQNYQLEMFDSGGRGQVNCQTCKLWPNYQMKISKTTN